MGIVSTYCHREKLSKRSASAIHLLLAGSAERPWTALTLLALLDRVVLSHTLCIWERKSLAI